MGVDAGAVVSDTVNVDTLVETLRAYRPTFAKAYEEEFDVALSDLAARARRSYPESWNEEIREVEDDRDRLREELSNAEFMRDGYFQSVDRLARRVAELEAALREIEAATNSSAVQRIARAALYGDGGGA